MFGVWGFLVGFVCLVGFFWGREMKVFLWYFLNWFDLSFQASWHYPIVNAVFSETPRAALNGQNSENGIYSGSVGDGDVKLWRLKCEDISGFSSFCMYCARLSNYILFFLLLFVLLAKQIDAILFITCLCTNQITTWAVSFYLIILVLSNTTLMSCFSSLDLILYKSG